jgi:hypothetical protein
MERRWPLESVALHPFSGKQPARRFTEGKQVEC